MILKMNFTLLQICVWVTICASVAYIGYVTMYRLGLVGVGPVEEIYDVPIILALISPHIAILTNCAALIRFLLKREWLLAAKVVALIGGLFMGLIVAAIIGPPTV